MYGIVFYDILCVWNHLDANPYTLFGPDITCKPTSSQLEGSHLGIHYIATNYIHGPIGPRNIFGGSKTVGGLCQGFREVKFRCYFIFILKENQNVAVDLTHLDGYISSNVFLDTF